MKEENQTTDKGHIYILKNKCMPNLYKIGMTRTSIEDRIKALNSSTSIPEKFESVAVYDSDHVAQLEKHIHRKLREKRSNSKREFFFFPGDEKAENEVSTIIERFKPHPYSKKEKRIIKAAKEGTPSALCKAAGLKNLNELSDITKQSTRTLINWHTNKPELFRLVLKGAVQKKKEMS